MTDAPEPDGVDHEERLAAFGARALTSRVVWVLAILAAIAGVAWYLVADSDLAWTVGLVLVTPLAVLILFKSQLDASAGGPPSSEAPLPRVTQAPSSRSPARIGPHAALCASSSASDVEISR